MKGFLFIIGAIVLIILLTFLRVSTGSHNTTAPAPRPLTTPKVLAPAPKPTQTVKTTGGPTPQVVASHTFTGVGSWMTPIIPAGSHFSVTRPVGKELVTAAFRVRGKKNNGDETCTFVFKNNGSAAQAFQVTCK